MSPTPAGAIRQGFFAAATEYKMARSCSILFCIPSNFRDNKTPFVIVYIVALHSILHTGEPWLF